MTEEEDFDEISTQLLPILMKHPNGRAVKKTLEFYLNHFYWDYDRRKIFPEQREMQKEEQDD